MKLHLIWGAAVAGALLLSTPAMAQDSDSATANGSTTIIRPVTIDKTADLAFGRIVKPTTGTGTVTMSDGADTVAAASGAVALSGITTSRAKFTIDGEGGQAVSIAVPATFDLSNSTDTITVTLDPDLSASESLSGSLGGAGTLSLNVGGNFGVPTGVSTGAYTGSFDVTVNYN